MPSLYTCTACMCIACMYCVHIRESCVPVLPADVYCTHVLHSYVMYVHCPPNTDMYVVYLLCVVYACISGTPVCCTYVVMHTCTAHMLCTRALYLIGLMTRHSHSLCAQHKAHYSSKWPTKEKRLPSAGYKKTLV